MLLDYQAEVTVFGNLEIKISNLKKPLLSNHLSQSRSSQKVSFSPFNFRLTWLKLHFRIFFFNFHTRAALLRNTIQSTFTFYFHPSSSPPLNSLSLVSFANKKKGMNNAWLHHIRCVCMCTNDKWKLWKFLHIASAVTRKQFMGVTPLLLLPHSRSLLSLVFIFYFYERARNNK